MRKTSLSCIGALLALSLSSCSSLGGSGPSSGAIKRAGDQSYTGANITLVDVNKSAITRIIDFENANSFAAAMGDAATGPLTIGAGDSLDIALWEAPPAVLFGLADGRSSGPSGAQTRTVIEQIVAADGTMTIPFVGSLKVAGLTPAQVERNIVQRLRGRANDPQAVVRLVQNDARNVTILGEVTQSGRVPLGPRGERLLDIVASAGGTRAPVGQTTIQLTRGSATVRMPLDAVIEDSSQNITMRPNDVVTVLHQPYSFIALGAINRSAEIPFEGKGISLAQALARVGGLRDDRANVKGVFVFRFENPLALEPQSVSSQTQTQTQDGRIPVVYKIDFSDATSIFAAQDFKLRDQDVIYVSTAPGADIQRFLNTISSVAFSFVTIANQVVTPVN